MNIKHLINSFSLTIFFFVIISCNKDESFTNKLQEAQCEMDSNPQLALSLLDSIVSPDLMGQEEHMQYILLFTQAKLRCNQSVTDDVSIFEAQKYFEKKSDANKTLLANYCSGSVGYQLKQFDVAVEYFKKSIQLSDSVNNNLMLAKSHLYLGHVYRESRKIEEAISSFRSAYNIFKEIPDMKFYEQQALTCIGLSYEILDKLDDAESYLIQSLRLATKIRDEENIGRSNYNLGLVALRKKDYIKTKHYFELAKPNFSDITQLYVSYAQLFTETNRLDSASYYMEAIKRNIPNISYNYQLAYTYDVLREYYMKEKNIDQAVRCSELRDSVRNEINKLQLNEKIEKQKQKAEIEAYYKSISHKNSMNAAINIIIILAILSVAIYLIMIRKERIVLDQVEQQKKEIDERVIDFVHFTPYIHIEVNPTLEQINPIQEVLKWGYINNTQNFSSFIGESISKFNAKVNVYLIERAKQILQHTDYGNTALTVLDYNELLILMYVRQRLPFRVMCILIGKPFKREELKVCLTAIKSKLQNAGIPDKNILKIMYPITHYTVGGYNNDIKIK